MKTMLFIDGLEVFANHGLFEEENRLGKALFSDEMTDSVSYADIADVVVKMATENTFNLLERLAGEMLKNIFDSFPEIENIKLKINKPAAPVRHHFEKCGVEVKISREEFYRL